MTVSPGSSPESTAMRSAEPRPKLRAHAHGRPSAVDDLEQFGDAAVGRPGWARDRNRVADRRDVDDSVDVRVGAHAAWQRPGKGDVGRDGTVLGGRRDARDASLEDAVAGIDVRAHADADGVHVALGDLQHRLERTRIGDVRDHRVLGGARPGSTSTLCTMPPVAERTVSAATCARSASSCACACTTRASAAETFARASAEAAPSCAF